MIKTIWTYPALGSTSCWITVFAIALNARRKRACSEGSKVGIWNLRKVGIGSFVYVNLVRRWQRADEVYQFRAVGWAIYGASRINRDHLCRHKAPCTFPLDKGFSGALEGQKR